MGGDGVYFETEGKIGIAASTRTKRGKRRENECCEYNRMFEEMLAKEQLQTKSARER